MTRSKYKRVSTFLKEAGLVDDRFFTEDGRVRGTNAHTVTQMYDNGDVIDFDTWQDVVPYLEGWKRFLQEMGVIIHFVERKVWCDRYRYRGTLDRVLEFNDCLWVVDIKTGAFARWHAIQTAAYEGALPPVMRGSKALRRRRATVYLLPNGKYKLHEHDSPMDRIVWNACLTIGHWKGE